MRTTDARSRLLLAGLVAGLTALMLWPALSSPFDLYNEHHFLHYAAPNGVKKPLGDFLRPLLGDVFRSAPRAFAANCVLHALEAYFLYGLDPFLWHASRVLMGMFVGTALFLAASAALPAPMAALVGLLAVAGPHAIIWCNVGLFETQAIALVAAGAALVAHAYRRRGPSPAALFPGLLVMSLSGFMKEPFVPVAPACLALAFLLDRLLPAAGPRKAPPRPSDRAALCALAALWAVQIGLVAYYCAREGMPYGTSLTVGAFGRALARALSALGRETLAPLPLLLYSRAALRSGSARARRELAAAWLFTAAAVALLVVPQAVAYGDLLPRHQRYFTPLNLAGVLAVAVGLFLFAREERETWRDLREARVFTLALFAGFLALQGRHVHALAKTVTAQNHFWQDRIEQVAARSESAPDRPVVFCSADLTDLEGLVSVQQFLSFHAKRPVRPWLAVRDARALAAQDAFRQKLEGELLGLVGDGKTFAGFYSPEQAGKAVPLVVRFHGAGTGCPPATADDTELFPI